MMTQNRVRIRCRNEQCHRQQQLQRPSRTKHPASRQIRALIRPRKVRMGAPLLQLLQPHLGSRQQLWGCQKHGPCLGRVSKSAAPQFQDPGVHPAAQVGSPSSSACPLLKVGDNNFLLWCGCEVFAWCSM